MIDLFGRAAAGDAAARDQLVAANLPLVHRIVNRFAVTGRERDDLFQVGCVGLIKAIDGFDRRFGTQFSTYAVPMILGEIRRYLRDDTAVKLPRGARELGLSALRKAEELTRRLGREPNVREIAAELGCEPSDVAEVTEGLRRPASLQAEDEDGRTLLDRQGNEGHEARVLDRLALSAALERLEPRAREILWRRYYQNQSQIDVARALGISQVHVSRLERRALHALRAELAG